MRNLFLAATATLVIAVAMPTRTSPALAQSGRQFTSIATLNHGGVSFACAIASDGSVYVNPTGIGAWSYLNTIPAPGPFVSIAVNSGNGFVYMLYALTSDGRAYVSGFPDSQWSSLGNVSGAPVPATQQSWSQVKSRYR